MLIAPNSDIIIYHNIAITNEQNIAWKSREEQGKYFKAHEAFTVPNNTYVRRNGTLKVPLTMAQLYGCNYLSFRNYSFESARIFCRIVNTEYVNTETSRIIFEIDTWQTFWDGVQYEGAYVERSHLSVDDQAKAEEDPWRSDVLELQTAEDTPQGESLYEHNPATFEVPYLSANPEQVMFIFGSNFSDEVPDTWKDYVNEIIYSDGTAKVSAAGFSLPPRAYWIGVIYGTEQTIADNFRRLVNTLTLQGVADSIISVFWCARAIWDRYLGLSKATATTDYREGIVPQKSFAESGFTNPKVLRAPYQFVEFSNQDGGIKDYKFENGSYVYDGGQGKRHGFQFVYFVHMDNRPYAAIVPYGYLSNTFNYDERIEFGNFPQAGYVTDSFLSFLATQYQTVLREQTAAPSSQLSRSIAGLRQSDNPVASTVGGLATYAGSIWEGVKAVLNIGARDVSGALESAGNVLQSADRSTLQSGAYDEASAVRRGEIPAGSVFGPAQEGYVNHQYFPGSGGSSILPFLDRVGGTSATPGQFIYRYKVMKKPVLDAVDRYFTLYGYAVRCYRVPYVCDYGKAGKAQPHFATDPVSGRKITYVKTRNMRVEGAQKWITDSIAAIFDSGVWFVEGGSLS